MTVNLPPTDVPCSVQMMLLLWFILLSNPITLYQVIRELTIRQMRRMPAIHKNYRSHGYVAGGNNVSIVQFHKVGTKNVSLLVVSHGYHINHNEIIWMTLTLEIVRWVLQYKFILKELSLNKVPSYHPIPVTFIRNTGRGSRENAKIVVTSASPCSFSPLGIPNRPHPLSTSK